MPSRDGWMAFGTGSCPDRALHESSASLAAAGNPDKCAEAGDEHGSRTRLRSGGDRDVVQRTAVTVRRADGCKPQRPDTIGICLNIDIGVKPDAAGISIAGKFTDRTTVPENLDLVARRRYAGPRRIREGEIERLVGVGMDGLGNPAVTRGIQFGKANAIGGNSRHGIPDFDALGTGRPTVATAKSAPKSGADRAVILETAIGDEVCLGDRRRDQ